jgi:hypothetical protein
MRVDNFGGPSPWLQALGPSGAATSAAAAPIQAVAHARAQSTKPNLPANRQGGQAFRPTPVDRDMAPPPSRASSSGRSGSSIREDSSVKRGTKDEPPRSKSAGKVRTTSFGNRLISAGNGPANPEGSGGRFAAYADAAQDEGLGATMLRPLGTIGIGSVRLDNTVAYNAAKRGAESAAWLRAEKEKVCL